MSSVSRINGFRYVKNLLGGGQTAQTNMYFVPASDATAIFIGDPVQLAGDARNPTGTPTVTKLASATGIPIGIVMGIAFSGMGDLTNVPPVNNLNTPVYRAASTDRYLIVCDDPNAVFETQFAGTSQTGASITGNVGLNGQFLLNAGNTSTGASGSQLDITGLATTATLPLKIVGFPYRPDNTPGDVYFSYWVKMNASSFSQGTGSAGTA